MKTQKKAIKAKGMRTREQEKTKANMTRLANTLYFKQWRTVIGPLTKEDRDTC